MDRKKLLALAAFAGLASCNGGSESGGTPAVSGTIMGVPFTPSDGGALALPAADCNLPGLGIRSLSGIALGFTSFTDVCGFVQTTGLCGEVRSSTIVSVNLLRAHVTGSAPPIGPGTYTVGTFIDQQGNILAVSAEIGKNDATCAAVPGIPVVQSGSVTFSSVSPRVAGALDVTFVDGSRFSGSFDVAVCPAAVNFCAVIADTCATSPCCTDATHCS